MRSWPTGADGDSSPKQTTGFPIALLLGVGGESNGNSAHLVDCRLLDLCPLVVGEAALLDGGAVVLKDIADTAV